MPGLSVGFAKYPNVAATWCQLISQLQYPNAAALLTDFLQLDTGQKVTVAFQPLSNVCPAFAVCVTDAKAWVLIGGAWNAALLSATANGYPGPIVQLGGDEATRHPLFESAAGYVMQVIDTFPTFDLRELMIGGHSLGGCVGTSVAERLRGRVKFGKPIQLATFGSPRWGTRLNCRNVDSVSIARWMFENDPIPLFYPHAGEWLPGLVVNNAFQVSRVNRFTHSRGGLLLYGPDKIAPAQYPPLAAVGFTSSMLSWLTANMVSSGNNPHSMDTYIFRLRQAAAALPAPTAVPTPEERPPADGAQDRQAVSRLSFAVETQLAAVERAQREAPVFIPPAHEVTYQRSGGVWAIRWQGHVIALSTRRRSAHSLARSINAMLEHLLTQGLMDRTALTQAVSSFLDLSVLSDSGITPTLPATPPTGVPG